MTIAINYCTKEFKIKVVKLLTIKNTSELFTFPQKVYYN